MVVNPELPNDQILKTYTASGTQTTPTIDLGPSDPGVGVGGIAVDAAGDIYITKSLSLSSTFQRHRDDV